MPNEPTEPGAIPETLTDLSAGGEVQVEAGSNDPAALSQSGDWRPTTEPAVLDVSLTGAEPAVTGEPDLPADATGTAEAVAEPDESTETDDGKSALPAVPTRHDISEEQLRELGLSWSEYCDLAPEARLELVNTKLAITGQSLSSDEVEKGESLLGSIADSSRLVVAARTSSWRRWVTGLRTLGLSEVGRFWARHSIKKINTEELAEVETEIAASREALPETKTPIEIAEDPTLQTTKKVQAARVIAAGITTALSFNYIGSNAARFMADRIPFGSYLFGAIAGVSGNLTGQQASYGLLRWSRNATIFNISDKAERHTRRIAGRDARKQERQEVVNGLKSHRRARFIYQLTNNEFWDFLADTDNRITPADLDQIVIDNQDGTENKEELARIEKLVGVLQPVIDLGGEEDWQYALYTKALSILANHNNRSQTTTSDIEAQSNRIAKRVRGERTMETAHRLVSKYIIGPVLGIGLAFNAFRAGAHVPTPVQPELIEYANPHAITSAIETRALSMLDSDNSQEHLQLVQNALQQQDDLAFFALTHHHLADLGFAEHALRAQLIEQLAHEQGQATGDQVLATADVWHADGTVDISVLQHGLSGVHEVHGGAVFEHLNSTQLATAHQEVIGDQIFADWRVDQITTVIHDTALREALHEHLTTVVAARQDDHNFWLSDHFDTKSSLQLESSLRTHADSFVDKWLHDHNLSVAAPVKNLGDHVTGVAKNAAETAHKSAFDFLPNPFAVKSHPGLVETPVYHTPVLSLAEQYTGVPVEHPVLNEQVYTLADRWHGPQLTDQEVVDHALTHEPLSVKTLLEPQHQVVDTPSHLAEPASTVRGETLVIHEPSLTAHPAAASVLESPTLPEPHHLAVDSSSHLSTPTDTARVATSHPTALETNNAAVLESQIFTRSADAVKPELPAHSLHNYVDTGNKESILIGPDNLGKVIPNEQPSFVAE